MTGIRWTGEKTTGAAASRTVRDGCTRDKNRMRAVMKGWGRGGIRDSRGPNGGRSRKSSDKASRQPDKIKALAI
jgi:hypothetical protein